MIRPSLAMVLAGTALAGCANLSVRVDAMSYESLQVEIQKAQDLRDFEAIVSRSDKAFAEDVARRKAQVLAEINALIEKDMPGNTAPGTGMRKTIEESIEAIFADYQKNSARDRERLRAHAARYRAILVRNGDTREIVALMNSLKSHEDRLTTRLRDELTEPVKSVVAANKAAAKKSAAAAKPAAAQPSDAQIQATATAEAAREVVPAVAQTASDAAGPIGGPTLFGSGYAALVTGAPEWAWKPRFNEARGQGWMGNTTVVIRMNSQGDFSVKGMSFDPSTVAATAQKAGVQAVMMVATISGVPVNPSSLSDPKDKVGLGAVDPSGAEAQRDTALARIGAGRSAARALAQAILVEEGRIKGTAEERTAANDSIKAVSDSLLPELGGAPEPAGGDAP